MEGETRKQSCLYQSYVAATERAAIATGRWLGRGDEHGARDSATVAMHGALDELPIDAKVVIGGPEDEDGVEVTDLRVGQGGLRVDLAIDALKGAEVVARGESGIVDTERVVLTPDLAPKSAIAAATGISNGDLLRGVRYLGDSARTHSVVMCTRCNRVRFVDGIHFYDRDRREELQLLG